MSPSPHVGFSATPLTVWVDSGKNLVSRLQGDITLRIPAHDETPTNKVTLRVARACIDQPISQETFEFTPPPDVLDTSDPGNRGGRIGSGGGGGGNRFDAGKGGQFENWHSHDWAGSTLIETSRLKLHGFNLAFERRLTISDDRREMRIVERVTTPAGTTEREISLPLAPSEH